MTMSPYKNAYMQQDKIIQKVWTLQDHENGLKGENSVYIYIYIYEENNVFKLFYIY